MTTFLDSSWPLICVVGYGVIVVALLLGNHRWVTLNRADITRRAAYPPPVPSPRPRSDDADWLSPWPTADEAEQAVYDKLFDRLIAIEGLDR